MRRPGLHIRPGLHVAPVVRWAVLFAVVCALASGFVYLRNKQVQTGHQLRAHEERIARLQTEIEFHEIRLAELMDRTGMAERLGKLGRPVQKIDPFGPSTVRIYPLERRPR